MELINFLYVGKKSISKFWKRVVEIGAKNKIPENTLWISREA